MTSSLPFFRSGDGAANRLKAFTLNCWAIGYAPAPFGSKDVLERVAAIAKTLANSDYDFVFLQELWRERDRATVSDSCRARYPHQISFPS